MLSLKIQQTIDVSVFCMFFIYTTYIIYHIFCKFYFIKYKFAEKNDYVDIREKEDFFLFSLLMN